MIFVGIFKRRSQGRVSEIIHASTANTIPVPPEVLRKMQEEQFREHMIARYGKEYTDIDTKKAVENLNTAHRYFMAQHWEKLNSLPPKEAKKLQDKLFDEFLSTTFGVDINEFESLKLLFHGKNAKKVKPKKKITRNL